MTYKDDFHKSPLIVIVAQEVTKIEIYWKSIILDRSYFSEYDSPIFCLEMGKFCVEVPLFIYIVALFVSNEDEHAKTT